MERQENLRGTDSQEGADSFDTAVEGAFSKLSKRDIIAAAAFGAALAAAGIAKLIEFTS